MRLELESTKDDGCLSERGIFRAGDERVIDDLARFLREAEGTDLSLDISSIPHESDVRQHGKHDMGSTLEVRSGGEE